MAVSTNNFKNGMAISHKGKLWVIVEFQHVKPGKGGAFVRTKLKEVGTGRVVEETFRAGEKVEDVRMETKQLQYLYAEAKSPSPSTSPAATTELASPASPTSRPTS